MQIFLPVVMASLHFWGQVGGGGVGRGGGGGGGGLYGGGSSAGKHSPQMST